jgi:ribosome-associated protein
MGASTRRSKTGPDAVADVRVDFPITVGQFVKAAGLVSTGGEAKMRVGLGQVRVNGGVELRRGHKLVPGDVVSVEDEAARAVPRSGGTGSTPGRVPPSPPRS